MLPVTNKAARELTAAELRAARELRDAERTAHTPKRGLNLSSMVGALKRSPEQAPAVAPPASAMRELPPAVRMASQLREAVSDEVVLLHHRRTPRVKPHIDHLAIAPSGVWIIHSRRNQGRVATRKPMFGDPKLTIGGRERTDLLMTLERQVSYVLAALRKDHPAVEVRSALCFVDTEAPLLRTLYLGSYLFFGAPAIAKHLNSEGPCTPERVQAIASLLEDRFPPA